MERQSIRDSSWIGPVAQLGPYHVQHKPDAGQTLVLYCEVEEMHRSVARVEPSMIFFTDTNYTKRKHVDMFVHSSYPRGQLLPSAACTLYDAQGEEWEQILSEQTKETEWVHAQTLGPFALDERPKPGQVVQFSCRCDFADSNNSSQIDEWNELIHLSPSAIYFAETNHSKDSYVRMFVDSSKKDIIQSLSMEISCSVRDGVTDNIPIKSFQPSKLDRMQEPSRWSQLAVAALVLFGSYIYVTSTKPSITKNTIETKSRDDGRRSRKPANKRKKCSKRSQCHNNNSKASQPQSHQKPKSPNSSSLLLADYLDNSNDSDSETGAEMSDSDDDGDESRSTSSQTPNDDIMRKATTTLLHNNNDDDIQDREWEQVGASSQNTNQKTTKSEPLYSFMQFRFKRNKTTAMKEVIEHNAAISVGEIMDVTTEVTQEPAEVQPKTYPATNHDANIVKDTTPVIQTKTYHNFQFYVEGMVCGGCESVVRNTIESLDEVEKAAVDVASGQTIVTSTNARLDLTALALALNDVGMKISMQVDEKESGSTTSANVATKTTQNFARESSLSLLDEIRMDSKKTVKRYRCSCNCNGCICRSHPFNEDDPGLDITLEDLCSRLESTLSASGAFGPLDGLTNEDGGTHELRDQLANLPIPCGCSSSSCQQET